MSHPGRLRDKIGAAIRDQALWSPGDRIAVAVSGGMDSVCLLDLLVRTQKWHRGDLSVVTVDHGVREESPMEADHAEGLAHAADLQCTRFALRLGPEASELDCRTARYRCFEQLDVDHVALGHHREDQVETVLLHLMRGTGTAGVRGMNWRRGRYVRPLLAVSRQELSDWASHRQLHWMDDASNQDPRYLRNALRAEVIPTLERLRPGASASIARSARLIALEDGFLESLGEAKLKQVELGEGFLDAKALLELPEALFRRVMRRFLPAPVYASHLDDLMRILRRGNGSVSLSGDMEIVVKRGKVGLTGSVR